MVETEEYLAQGSLHDHIVVSVPVSMSHRSAHQLSEQLVREFDKPVLIVTHNIHFVRLERLTKEEADAVVERVTSRVVEEELALAQLKKLEAERDPTTNTDPVAADAADGRSRGDGDGSGLCLVRDSGASAEPNVGVEAGSEVGPGDRDEEGS